MSAPRGRLFRLCQKELRETLRDRRTIVTLVLMPLLVYPILSMTLNRFLLTAGAPQGNEIIIGVRNASDGEWLNNLLTDPRSLPPEIIAEAASGGPAEFEFAAPGEGRNLEQNLREGLCEVAVYVESERPRHVLIKARENDAASIGARRILVERITYYNHALVRERARASETLDPPSIDVQLGLVVGGSSQSMLASIIPLVLVLMTITGAVYPAIDLTAGERERGTMEALIASPVPRGAVLFAKYVAVVTVALLTAVANLGAMFVTLWAGGLLELLVGKDQPIPWMQFLQILGLLVLFSGFFSAVLLALTSFARSFKEAQAYLIPLMLVSLTPAVLSLMPGIEMKGPLAVLPLLNIILLSREILAGNHEAVPTIAAIFSTICYAAAALGIAAKLFGSDAVLRGSEMSIGAAVRRPTAPRPRPSISEAAMTLALLFPVYYLSSNLLAHSSDAPISQRLILSALLAVAMFGGIPLLAVLYCRDDLAATYRTARPSLLAVLGAVLMGLGLWAWAHEIFLAAELLGFDSLDKSKISGVEAMLEQLRQTSPILVVATLALAPAVVEELCFRGYLFSALRGKLSAGETIVATAILFGLFHVLTGSVLLLERFLPTTMLGLVLGTLAWRTGSVWPGVAMHFTHNALLELVAVYREELEEWGIGIQENQQHLPVTWIATCTALVVFGSVLVWWARRRVTTIPGGAVPLTVTDS